MDTMQAVWLENGELTYRRDAPIPRVPPGEALVKIRRAGICSTDLELVKGYYPFTGIPGHEFVGDIVDCPDRPERVGQRVVGEINAPCGICTACVSGRPRHCPHRTVLGIVNRNGAFAEYLTLPTGNLIRVPDAVSDAAAVFVEPLAAALQIQQQNPIRPTDRVLVLGAGRLGQLIAQAITGTGCALQVAARHPVQRRLLERRQIPWIDEAQVRQRYYDIVIDATGTAAGFDAARRAVRPAGTIVVKSTYKGELGIDLSALVVDEITVVGSRCGPFAPALRLLEKGIVDPTFLMADLYPLSNAAAAFNRAKEPGVLKVVFVPYG